MKKWETLIKLDENLIIKMYLEKEMSLTKIAETLNSNPTTIKRRLLKNNIKMRGKGVSLKLEIDSKIDFLTIKSYTDEKRDGCVLWLCECICGKIVKRTHTDLRRRKIKSCGCRGNGKIDIIPQHFYTRIETAMSNKGFSDLDYKFLCDLFRQQKGKCNLSGLEIYFNTQSKIITASLDRMNNNIGYIKTNVQWLHKNINYMKYTIPQADFIEYCKLITNFNRIDNNEKEVTNIPKKRLAILRKRAKRKNIKFNLTYDFINNLYKQQNGMCALSGVKIPPESISSLDRISSKYGYTENNVQWVHKDVNFMKNKQEQDIFLYYCKLVADNN